MKVDPDLIQIIEEMLYEFETNKPEVCLVPSQDENCAEYGGMIRVATTQNPEWYRNMCGDFPRPVQPSQPREKSENKRTVIKRKDTVSIFNRLLEYGGSKSKYAGYIIGEAQRRLESYSHKPEKSEVPF